MHTKTKGDIGLLAASLFFAKQGYAVFKEIGDLSCIDLIVEKDGKLLRVQCKAMVPKDDSIPVSFIKSGPGYKYMHKQTDFDYMSILNLNDDKLYLIPSSLIDGRTGITLNEDSSKESHKLSNYLAQTILK